MKEGKMPTSKGQRPFLFFVTHIAWIIPLCAAYGYQDSGERDRTTRLETQVEILTNEVKRLKEIVGELRCSQRPVTPEESMDNENEQTVNHMEHDNLFLRQVRRELTSLGIRLSVEFGSNPEDREDLHVKWFAMTSFFSAKIDALEDVLIEGSEDDEGLLETYVDLDETLTSKYSEVKCWIYNSKVSYTLSLNTTADFPVVQNTIDLPFLQTTPSHDIVYEIGQNASFKMTFNRSDEYYAPNLSGRFLNISSDHLFFSHEQEDFFEARSTKTFLETKEEMVVIDTATWPLGGLVSVSERKRQENGLVNGVELVRKLILRPSNQRGPFPDGFLQFLTYASYPEEDITINCNVKGEGWSMCFTTCELFGENIEQLVAKVINDNGQERIVSSSEKLGCYRTNYQWEKMFSLSTDRYGTGRQRFVCEAQTSRGATLTHSVNIVFYEPVELWENLTTVSVANKSEMTFICAATGDPQPNFEFIWKYGVDDSDPINRSCVDAAEHQRGSRDVFEATLTLDKFQDQRSLSLVHCMLSQNISYQQPVGKIYDIPDTALSS